MDRRNIADTRDLIQVTIPNAGQESQAVDLSNHRLIAVQMSAAWTAGNLQFMTSVDGVAAYIDVTKSDGVVFAFTPAAGKYYAFSDVEQKLMNSIRFLKAKSAVVQGGDRVLTLVTSMMR